MRSQPSLLVVIVLSIAAFGGCGSGSSSPAGPSTPPPAPPSTRPIISVAVTAPPIVYIGQQQTATATGTRDDGTTTPTPAGEWTSEDAAIASVNATGRVSGVANGTTALRFAATGGPSARAALRVAPDYGGIWLGGFRVRSCQVQGIFENLRACDLFQAGNTYYLASTFAQSGLSVNGHVDISPDRPSNTVTYEVPPDGRLRFDARIDDGQVRYRLIFDATSLVPGAITGDLSVLIRFEGSTGEATLKCDLVDYVRTSGIVTPAPMSSRARTRAVPDTLPLAVDRLRQPR
jgi:hypothetical protein